MTTPWTGAVADGDACFYSYECAGTGSGTSYCAPDQTCKALPGNGMACSSQGCALGTYCDETVDMCKTAQGVGGTCTEDLQCMTTLFCELSGSNGTCQMLLGGGSACTSSTQCESKECFPGTCTGSTDTCFTDANCEGTCSTGPETGDFCETDENCEGHCSVTTTEICDSATCPVDETCVFNTCSHPTCDGDIVCAATEVTADYCTGPVSEIGIVSGSSD